MGYEIGFQHTRHDQIVSYLTYLSTVSNKADLINYGKTHEGRDLIILTVTSESNLNRLDDIQKEHLKNTVPGASVSLNNDLPIIINLGYGVHGNEPSSSEAALLTAYTLVASKNKKIEKFRQQSIVFIDPTINPDGRDRHTQWVNQNKSINLVADEYDSEHNEAWPRGRTNHYWFDLNRDWLLAVNPESRNKLKWFHTWYPNVVTDFHEMGTNSNYFFEPMKTNASVNPLIPDENYNVLSPKFAEYYVKALDSIGSFYYTKESFDETYPGYGSSYPDVQGGLAILFEQASSRGHLQETNYGTISFGFTIRNQYLSSIATVEAAVDNKKLLRDYQKRFFDSSWSMSNFYNMKSRKLKNFTTDSEILSTNDLVKNIKVNKSNYSYILDWDDYNSVAALNYLQKNNLITYSAFKPFSVRVNETSGIKNFNYGSILIPVSKQKISSNKLYEIIKNAQEKFNVPIYNSNTGFSIVG